MDKPTTIKTGNLITIVPKGLLSIKKNTPNRHGRVTGFEPTTPCGHLRITSAMFLVQRSDTRFRKPLFGLI